LCYARSCHSHSTIERHSKNFAIHGLNGRSFDALGESTNSRLHFASIPSLLLALNSSRSSFPSQMDNLAAETFLCVCEYLHLTHRPSLLSLALANKQCLRLATALLFHEINITVECPETLADDVQMVDCITAAYIQLQECPPIDC